MNIRLIMNDFNKLLYNASNITELNITELFSRKLNKSLKHFVCI